MHPVLCQFFSVRSDIDSFQATVSKFKTPASPHPRVRLFLPSAAVWFSVEFQKVISYLDNQIPVSVRFGFWTVGK